MTDHVPFGAYDKPIPQPAVIGKTLTAELPPAPPNVRYVWLAGIFEDAEGLRAAIPGIDQENRNYKWDTCHCQPAHRDHGEALQCLTDRYNEAQQ